MKRVYKAPRGFDLTFGWLQTVGLNEDVKWKEGKCRLSVKHGKRRRLVKGEIVVDESDCSQTGMLYHYYFKPCPMV